MLSRPRPHAWARWSDARLLTLRFDQLHLRIAGTWLEECVQALHAELAARNLRLRPHVWLTEEWFSPTDIPGIGIPFYLAHPRLAALERRQTGAVEGGSRRECLRILRHEAGHVVQHAFALHRRRQWRELFGPPSLPYPDYYRPRPMSRRFVRHLPMWYAQSHPDEDFAETFAVWLAPRGDWRRRYAGWPALRKLDYVDALMAELAGRRPPVTSRARVEPLSHNHRTLAEHYAARHARERHAPAGRGWVAL